MGKPTAMAIPPSTHRLAASRSGPVTTPATATAHARGTGPSSNAAGARSGNRRSLGYAGPLTHMTPTSAANTSAVAIAVHAIASTGAAPLNAAATAAAVAAGA